jgi:hypothetical protein
MSVFLVLQTLEQLYTVGTASISRIVFRSKQGVCCQAAKPQFFNVSYTVLDYLYVCTRIFNLFYVFHKFTFFF